MTQGKRWRLRGLSYLITGVTSVALAIGALAAPASAVGPNAIVDLPGCTANTLPANDDGSTDAVPIGFTANFAGLPYTELYVNNNGNVTFVAPLSDYTPFDFSISGDVIIAPFLADVDTRGVGSSEVTYGQTTFDGRAAFCVNWRTVGYYNSHADKLNHFQLLLVQRGTAGGFDAIFNYDQVQWETGDASGGVDGFGGTSAAWGYANGDGDPSHLFVGGGSFSEGALLDGGPAALTAGHLGTTQLGRYVFAISETGPTGPQLSGQVTSGGGSVPFTPVQICPTGVGVCVTRMTDASGNYLAFGLSGTYNLTAFPPSNSSRAPGHAGPVTIGADDVVQDIELGDAPAPPPDDTTITSIDTTDDGLPVAYWGDPLTLTTHACPGGTASYAMSVDGTVRRSGAMTEGPAGTFTATLAALLPVHGNGLVHITVTCPTPTDNETVDFGVYIDPSGKVRNSLGAPVVGATVELLRSGSPGGTFAHVPDGSPVMSPANRRNTDLTDDAGRFGWDVTAGYYKVRASKAGCVSNANRGVGYAETPVLSIPPAVTNLDLALYCGEGTQPTPPVVTPPVVTPPAPPVDRTAPNLTGLKLSPKKFKVAKKTGRGLEKQAAKGSKISFRVSERARVKFTIGKAELGRQVGGTCKAETKRNKKHKRCTRYVVKGTVITGVLAAGGHNVAFSGRIGSKKLKAGHYRLLAVPTDLAGNRGHARSALFRIVLR